MSDKSDKESLFMQILDENRSRLRIIARANTDGDHYLDLEQEILLALWKSLALYQGRSSLKTWFYGVASNVVVDFLRRDRRCVRVTSMVVAEELASYGSGHNRDPMAILEEFTRSLGELDRMVFLMSLDNVSYREMAEATGLQEANLRVKLSRIKKQYESRYIGS